MTPLRYAFARVFTLIGFGLKTKRLGEATAETHLLREAEEVLGYLCWKEVEGIDDLSAEYWNIRELKTSQIEKIARLRELEGRLQNKQVEREGIIASASQQSGSLREERARAVAEAEELAQERDACVTEAKRVRHLFDGQQTKLKVILQSPDGETSKEAASTREQLVKIRSRFEELRSQRSQIADRITEADAHISELNERISQMNSGTANEVFGSSASLGTINREVSSLRAEIGQLDKQTNLLYMKIGNYLTRFAKEDPACANACKNAKSLSKKVMALRQSILLNNRLIEQMGR